MTVHAPAERPRILAQLAERPGQTSYELAAALGYGKPDSHRIDEIVRRLWNDGALVAGSAYTGRGWAAERASTTSRRRVHGRG